MIDDYFRMIFKSAFYIPIAAILTLLILPVYAKFLKKAFKDKLRGSNEDMFLITMFYTFCAGAAVFFTITWPYTLTFAILLSPLAAIIYFAKKSAKKEVEIENKIKDVII